MKAISLQLTLILVALSGVALQEASAQERTARFKFPPNYYKIEQPRVPAEMMATRHNNNHQPNHAVRHGSMPQSSSFLGVTPDMVQPTEATPVVTAQAFVPATSFQPSFGKPVVPMQAKPAALQPAQQKAASKPASTVKKAPVKVHKSVSGIVRKPTSAPSANSAVASYGNNFGYAPGAYVPSQSGSMTTKKDVFGRVLPHQ